MTMTDTFTRISVHDITVLRETRQRRAIDTHDLEESIRDRGVYNPIIVRRDSAGTIILVAGERRLQASRNLNLPDIPVRFAHDLPPVEYEIIELEENIKRKDLDWRDRARATARIDALHRAINPEWTQSDTANSISVVPAVVSNHIRVVEQLDDPRVAECSTMREALSLLERVEARQRDVSLSIFLRPQSAEPAPQIMHEASILNLSFLDWAPTYAGEPFNLIHCDFPYGIGVADGPVGRGHEHTFYEDTTEGAMELVDCLVANSQRLLAVSGHIMFWYSDKLREDTLSRLNQIPGVFWLPHPLIWVHAESGITPDYRRRPKHVYDTCLLGTRDRYIVKVASDVFQCPTDTSLHPSTKPEVMLAYFMSMLVDEHTTMLDPTCGSGSSLRAAESLGAKRVLGLEIDPGYYKSACSRLADARLMSPPRSQS